MDRPTNKPTDMIMYRAAIAANNRYQSTDYIDIFWESTILLFKMMPVRVRGTPLINLTQLKISRSGIFVIAQLQVMKICVCTF